MKWLFLLMEGLFLDFSLRAQPWPPDTAEMFQDSLSVPYKSLIGPRFCFSDLRVIDSDSALRMLKERCKYPDDSLDFNKEILMFRSVGGDCHAWYKHRLYLDPDRKKLVWIVYNYYGGCRAGGGRSFWFIVPRPPEGYKVEMKTYLMNSHGKLEGRY